MDNRAFQSLHGWLAPANCNSSDARKDWSTPFCSLSRIDRSWHAGVQDLLTVVVDLVIPSLLCLVGGESV